MEDLQLRRAVKSGLLGGLWAGAAVIFARWCANAHIGVLEIFPGVVAGTAAAVVPFAFLPRGFSLPNDIRTLTFRGIGTFCLWVVADGLMKGEIRGLPKGGFFQGFMTLISWKEYAPIFLMCLVYWSALALLFSGAPIFYFRKAIRDTSPLISLPGSSTFDPLLNKWNECPEDLRAVFVFTVALSSILVFLYLALAFGP